MAPTDFVITGLGVVSSIGIGADAFAEAINAGRSGVGDLLELSSDDFPDLLVGQTLRDSRAFANRPSLSLGAPIVGFDAKQFVRPRKALKVMCREIQTSYAASHLSISDAGLAELSDDTDDAPPPTVARERIGTVFGSEMLYGLPIELADAFADCVENQGRVDPSRFGGAAMQKITPLWMLKYLPNMPACHFGIAIGALGPNNTITAGDVSGPSAIIEGCGYLRRGIADIMVVAAAGSRINVTRSIFTEDQPLADHHAPVERSSRPHALDARGVVRGEGAASLILETRDSANRRQGKVLARVMGAASRFVASDSFQRDDRNARADASAGRGSSRAMELAIEAAFRQSRCSINDVGLVIGHGMGDPVIDAAERSVLTRICGRTPLSFPIAAVGHTGAASGMLELAAAVVALRTGVIAPVPHAGDCPSELNVSDTPRRLAIPRVLVLCHTSPGAATAVLLCGDDA